MEITKRDINMKTSSMSNKNSRFNSLVIALFFTISLTENAYAYVDPGSGSVIVTAVLGFIAAISYTFRKYFYNLKKKFRSNNRNSLKSGSKND